MSSLRFRRGRYYLIFTNLARDPQQKQVALGAISESAANRLKLRYEDQYATGEFDPWNTITTERLDKAIDQFLGRKKRQNRSKSTIRTYRQILLSFASFHGEKKQLNSVTRASIERWLDSLSASVTTQAKNVSHMSTFFNWAIESGLDDRNPAARIDLGRVPRRFPKNLTDDQVEAICDAIRKTDAKATTRFGSPIWLVNVIMFTYYTGLRLAEVCNMRWQDVDLQDGLIYVRMHGSFRTKSKAERVVPIQRDLEPILDRIPRTSEYLFVTSSGEGPINPYYLSKKFRQYVRKAGIQKASFHSLRHTAISRLVRQGVPMEAIRRFAGHSSISVTERYAHLSDSDFVRLIRR